MVFSEKIALLYRRIFIMLAALILIGMMFGLQSPVASATSATTFPVFSVMNTSETSPDGVWFRNSARISDTDKVDGHGVYAGDSVQLMCYVYGEVVGNANNSLWYFVTNITRPTVYKTGAPNVGYLNAHYINDGMQANQTDAGVSQCLPQLTTSGNHIMQNGQSFTFHGVNRDTLEWGNNNWGGCGGDGHFTDADFDLIKSWNFTAVRVPLSQANLLGRRCDPTMYMQMIDAVVARINARGMYAILDLHWSDAQGQVECDSDCTSGQQPMPDSDSITFWQQIATHFANNPGVIFDLYNEPHPNATNGQVSDSDWNCWVNGGCTVTASTNSSVTYTAVGMQQLYDTVRSIASQNLILIGGPDWASDLSGVLNGYAINGTNLAYDIHVYTQYHNTVSDWNSHFGDVASVYPVVATEFGSIDCGTTYTSALLSYFDAPEGNVANKMSWAIWSWSVPGDCTQPSIIADWNGTPLPGQGVLIYDYLNPAEGCNTTCIA